MPLSLQGKAESSCCCTDSDCDVMSCIVTSLSGDESCEFRETGDRVEQREMEGRELNVGRLEREVREVRVGRCDIFKEGIKVSVGIDSFGFDRMDEIGRLELRDVAEVRLGKFGELRAGNLLAKEVREALERDGRGDMEVGRKEASLTRGGRGPR